MLNTRMQAAMTVKNQMKAAELAANASLIEVGNLLTVLGQASVDTGLLAIGQPAVEKALEMATAATALRGLAGEAHRALAQARIDAGLGAVSFGDNEDCPNDFTTSVRLRAA